jgi:hypothetical protein
MELKIESLNDVKKLLAGEHESQNKISVGYTEEKKEDQITRQIGDRWFDDDGNEWEQKNGYKIKLGKEWQQELHEYLTSFPNCQKEKCTCSMPKKIDEKMRGIHGMCFDCVVSMEHKIRLEGKWDEYEKRKVKENALSWLKDAERDKDMIASELSKLEFTNDFGDNEKWKTPFNKEEMLKKIEKEFEEFRNNFIKKLEEDLEKNSEET